MSEEKIKQCPKCETWFNAQDIMNNPRIIPIGMTFDAGDSQNNLFFFNHLCDDCGTTFTVQVDLFEKLLDKPSAAKILAATEVCENHCHFLDDIEICEQECKYASYRKLLNKMIEIRAALAKQP